MLALTVLRVDRCRRLDFMVVVSSQLLLRSSLSPSVNSGGSRQSGVDLVALVLCSRCPDLDSALVAVLGAVRLRRELRCKSSSRTSLPELRHSRRRRLLCRSSPCLLPIALAASSSCLRLVAAPGRLRSRSWLSSSCIRRLTAPTDSAGFCDRFTLVLQQKPYDQNSPNTPDLEPLNSAVHSSTRKDSINNTAP